MPRKFRIKSALSEDQIEADVSNYFGWVSPEGHGPFRLTSVNEQDTGADKKFEGMQGFIPIYMQFKVSQGLEPMGKVNLSRKPLQNIRRYRKNNLLNDNPTLYFRLRDRAANATDFQHNVLRRLSNGVTSHAFYVAPLHLSLQTYHQALDNSERYLLYPFDYRFYSEPIHTELMTFHFSRIPFLREHISIPPHCDVDTSEHYYSYGESGGHIAFHSRGSMLKDKFGRLGERFDSIMKVATSNAEYWDPMMQVKFINELKLQEKLQNQEQLDIAPLQRIIDFGKFLRKNYGIVQYLLMAKVEYLKAIRK